MIEIVDKRTELSGSKIRVGAIPRDTVFLGRIGSYSGLFVRIFDGVVLLDDEIATWSTMSATSTEVRIINQLKFG